MINTIIMVIIVARIGMLINKSCNLYVFCCFLSEKTGTFSANFNIYFMLKMLEMAFPGFKFQKFSGGGKPPDPPTGRGLRPRLCCNATVNLQR